MWPYIGMSIPVNLISNRRQSGGKSYKVIKGFVYNGKHLQPGEVLQISDLFVKDLMIRCKIEEYHDDKVIKEAPAVKTDSPKDDSAKRTTENTKRSKPIIIYNREVENSAEQKSNFKENDEILFSARYEEEFNILKSERRYGSGCDIDPEDDYGDYEHYFYEDDFTELLP